MKASPYKMIDRKYIPCDAHEATHVLLMLPGPICNRMLPVILKGKREGTKCWSWNGDTEQPTLKPSILTRYKRQLTEDEYHRVIEGEIIELDYVVCHSFVNDGKVQFLADCTHEFAGQTMDLLDID